MAITAKGEARRMALLDAALVVLERGGPTAVTHRSVAAEAGVPLSAATYYFATLDDLYLSALRRATEEQQRLFTSLADADVPAFARTIHEWAHDNRAAAIAQYELIFLAMRRTNLREDAELWYRSLERAIDPGDEHPGRTRVTAQALDGLMLRMLLLGDPATVADTEAAVRAIVGR